MSKIAQPEEVIKTALENHPKEGWYVYHYKIGWGILGQVVRMFYLALFGGMVFVFWISEPRMIMYMIISAIPACIAFIMVLNQAITLLHAKTNVIVFTEKSVIKSFRGKIVEYFYTDISNLRSSQVSGNSLPQRYIEFTDKKTGKIVELARNRQFGLAQNIFSVLQSKIN